MFLVSPWWFPNRRSLQKRGESVSVESRFDYRYLMGLAVDEETALEQTCCLFFETVVNEEGQYELHFIRYQE